MTTSTKRIGSKGEVVIPKKIREKLNLRPNSKVEIISTKQGILIIPLVEKLGDLAGLFEVEGDINMEELDLITHEYFAGI